MTKYQLRSPVEAMQWDGSEERAREIVAWVHDNDGHAIIDIAEGRILRVALLVTLFDKEERVWHGDYVIRGKYNNEFFPLPRRVFESLFEEE